MISKIKLFFGILLFFILSFFVIKPVSAAAFTLSGNVQDSTSAVISGATVDVKDTSNNEIGNTTTDANGNYSISNINSGTYNISLTPPFGSNYSPVSAPSYNITTDNVLNFVLVPAGTTTITGYVYNSLGSPVTGQIVGLRPAGNSSSFVVKTTTDSTGYYTLQSASGTYDLVVDNPTGGNSSSVNMPEIYEVKKAGFSLSQSEVLNFTIPVSQVQVTVKDPTGATVPGASISVLSGSLSSLSLGSGITGATGGAGYGTQGGTQAVTDQNGNVTLWLIPTSRTSYSFTINPPSGSSYGTLRVSNVFITGDTQQTFTFLAPVTVSGQVLDPLGNPVAGQIVGLRPAGNSSSFIVNTTTDANGNYSFQQTPGTYDLVVDNPTGGNSSSVNLPQVYEVKKANYSLTQNTTINFTIPTNSLVLTVKDANGNPVSGVNIRAVTNTLSNLTIASGITGATGSDGYGIGGTTQPSTDQNGNIKLWLLPSNTFNSYTITATPPTGSIYLSTSITVSLTSNMQKTITLPAQNVTITGTVYDPLGNPVGGQIVGLRPVNDSSNYYVTTTTNSSGNYSLQWIPGTYDFVVDSPNGGNSSAVNLPQVYEVRAGSYSLSQNTTLNITIPAKKVSIHVQDPLGKSLQSVSVGSVTNTLTNLNIGSGITNAFGSAGYGIGGTTPPQTDQNGDTILWLLPDIGGGSYTFTATPATGNTYSSYTLSNIVVTADQTELIALQFSHPQPVTNAILSPSQNPDGSYNNPTTVTLSASAYTGFSIANTYYTIDGGSQQTYTAPFSISTDGNHTITYWSIDNAGVYEAPNTKTFTVHTNQAPIVAPLSDAQIVAGTTYTATGSFTDPDSSSWTATVDYGDGSGQQPLTLNADNTFDLSHQYNATGTYTLTVSVTDNQGATRTVTATIGVTSASQLVLGINAGGDTEGNYVADTNVTGGSTYSVSDGVNTTQVVNPAPQAVYQSSRYGNFTYTLNNLTPGGQYTLRLHFNELYWGTWHSAFFGGVGSRVFNVSVNGTQELSSFDIYSTAGGANTAITEQFPVTPDSNGTVTIDFSSVTDNALVNGIELYSGTLPVPPPPTPLTSVSINAGGNAAGNYITDTGFSGGQIYSSTASVDTSAVTNPAPEAAYQSVRYGTNFTYHIFHLIPNTSYHVNLHFNELYWGTDLANGNGGEGSRVFNVAINGTDVLDNFDIFATAGGANKAIVEPFTATSDSNGIISISFTSVTDNAMVNGFEVFQ